MKNILKLRTLFSFLCLVTMANCASISTLQTGRVLKVDESQHSIGLATYQSDDFLGGDSISMPLLEYSYRRGVWDKIDVGVKLALIGSAMVDLKYNILNGEKWAFATGLGLGYLSFESESAGTTAESSILDIVLPAYLSYDVTELVTVYSAGKYILRSISSETVTGADGSMVSATLGVKYGNKAGVFLEGSLISGLDNSFTGSQFNASYFFGF